MTPYNMDFYESSQSQPNAQDQERSPTSTEIHSALVTPAPDLGGQLSPFLMPHTQACAPLKPGFWKGTPGSFPCILPDTTWLQTPLCWQVPTLLQSRLVCTAWHQVEEWRGQPASRLVQPTKDGEKPTEIKGLPLL